MIQENLGGKVEKWVSVGKKATKGALMSRLLLLSTEVPSWWGPPRDCAIHPWELSYQRYRKLGCLSFSSHPSFVEGYSFGGLILQHFQQPSPCCDCIRASAVAQGFGFLLKKLYEKSNSQEEMGSTMQGCSEPPLLPFRITRTTSISLCLVTDYLRWWLVVQK